MPDAGLLPQLMLLLGMVLLATILLRKAYRRAGKSKPNRQAIVHVSRPTAGRATGDTPPEFLQAEVQLQETVRRASGILDAKMLALHALVQQAQAKIDELHALQQSIPSGTQSPVKNISSPALPQPTTPPTYTGPHAEIYTLADQGFSAPTIAHRTHTPLAEVQRVLQERTV